MTEEIRLDNYGAITSVDDHILIDLARQIAGEGDPMLVRDIMVKHEKRKSRLWRLACLYDGVNPDASFVVFSDENPFAAAYDELMALR